MRPMLSAFLLASLITTPALADEPAAFPDGSTLELPTYSGSGCPAGTVAVNVSPDSEAFTVTFSELGVEAGPNVEHERRSRSCDIAVKVNPLAGYTFAIRNANVRGFVQTGTAAIAAIHTTYRFDGAPPRHELDGWASGTVGEDFLRTFDLDDRQLQFAPCGASQVVHIGVELMAAASPADRAGTLLQVDSVDLELPSAFVWKPCTR